MLLCAKPMSELVSALRQFPKGRQIRPRNMSKRPTTVPKVYWKVDFSCTSSVLVSPLSWPLCTDIREWMTNNVPNDYVNTKPICHSVVDSQFEDNTGNWSEVLTFTVLGAINLNVTAVAPLSAAAFDELLLQELSEQLSLDHSDITLSNFISPVSDKVKTVTTWMK